MTKTKRTHDHPPRNLIRRQLRALLHEFEQGLRDAGLQDATIRTYVDRLTYFVRWLDDDDQPRGPNR